MMTLIMLNRMKKKNSFVFFITYFMFTMYFVFIDSIYFALVPQKQIYFKKYATFKSFKMYHRQEEFFKNNIIYFHRGLYYYFYYLKQVVNSISLLNFNDIEVILLGPNYLINFEYSQS